MVYIRKTKTLYKIIGKSSYGVEDIDIFDTRKEAREMIAEYRLAMPTFSLWIKSKRVKKEDC